MSGADGFDEVAERYVRAMHAAAESIVPNRRHLDEAEATAIVIGAFASEGQELLPDADAARSIAFNILHPHWALLHPLKAHREGWRFGWPWASDDDWDVPLAVDDAANTEAWRLTRYGAGLLSESLEPALCERISKSEYSCVCEIPASEDHAAHRVEMRLSYRKGRAPEVTSSQLRPG